MTTTKDLLGPGWSRVSRERGRRGSTRVRGSGAEPYPVDGQGLRQVHVHVRELRREMRNYAQRTNAVQFDGLDVEVHNSLVMQRMSAWTPLAQQAILHFDRLAATYPAIEAAIARMDEFEARREREAVSAREGAALAGRRADEAEIAGDTQRAEYLRAQQARLTQEAAKAESDLVTVKQGRAAYVELVVSIEDESRSLVELAEFAAAANDAMFTRADLASQKLRAAGRLDAAREFDRLLGESLQLNADAIQAIKDRDGDWLEQFKRMLGKAAGIGLGALGVLAAIAFAFKAMK